MTTLSTAIKAALEADTGAGGVATLLTGGIYDWAELGRLGISRDNTATSGAYDANGKLKPCAFVRSRSEVPDGLIEDTTPVASVRETVEIWFYQDDGLSTIESAADRAFRVLHQQRPGTADQTVRYQGSAIRTFDPAMDAFVIRSVYVAGHVKT